MWEKNKKQKRKIKYLQYKHTKGSSYGAAHQLPFRTSSIHLLQTLPAASVCDTWRHPGKKPHSWESPGFKLKAPPPEIPFPTKGIQWCGFNTIK